MLTMFHMVHKSPFPVFLGFTIMSFLCTFIFAFSMSKYWLMWVVFIIIVSVYILFQWWRDVHREASWSGEHGFLVLCGLKEGFILFILSEVCFFASFFWAFITYAIAPDGGIGMLWPPVGVTILDPISVPLLNTIILLSSGATITASHHNLLVGVNSKALAYLVITLILGAVFTGFQAMEYLEAAFTMADSVYGNAFFMMTGFHGIHVLIGSIFILFMLLRMVVNSFNPNHHAGYEMSAWYWHFVDVVWLLLFVIVYLWSSY